MKSSVEFPFETPFTFLFCFLKVIIISLQPAVELQERYFGPSHELLSHEKVCFADLSNCADSNSIYK